MDNVKSIHVVYALHTYKVIHIFWFLFILFYVLFAYLCVGSVAVHYCSLCDQLFQPSLFPLDPVRKPLLL